MFSTAWPGAASVALRASVCAVQGKQQSTLCSRQLPDSLKLAFLFVLTPLRQEKKRKPELARLRNLSNPSNPRRGHIRRDLL